MNQVIRAFQDEDAPTICTWVNETGALPLIASEPSNVLTKKIFYQWIETAYGAFVLSLRGEIIAFATCTNQEWSLPPGFAEVGHLIVAPEQRRLYHGSFLSQYIARLMYTKLNVKHVVGRVVPTNQPALQLMNYLRWKEATDSHEWSSNTPFRWFQSLAQTRTNIVLSRTA